METLDPNAATMPPEVDSNSATLPPESVAGTDASGPPPVPGYEIVRELGRGGMGVVYLARQTKLNRLVALKMVLAGGHASTQMRQRFLAEAEAVAAVQHPHVVQLYDFGTHDDRPYFALEYCAGGSLKDKLAGTPMAAKPAAELVAKIAVGVQAAHDAGHIHRDLKPDNVLFAADGTPKVTDFGLARRFDTDSHLTNTGAILGTPSYMAPEQAAARKDIGPPADVYALGAILYECLTGRPPFRAATALDTVLQVVNEEPVAPRALVPGLPADIETVCLKCLDKEPPRRYPSAAGLAAELDRFAAGDPITARPVSRTERLWKAAKKNPKWTALVLTAVLAPVGFVILAFGSLLVIMAEQARFNVDLQIERQRADEKRVEAEKAHADADAQRVKAHARLKKGVEAVEQLTGRLNGREWSRNPTLAAERKKILDDVTTFYQGFDEVEAADPLIRRETARALYKVGAVALMLGEYDKATAAFDRARAGYAALADEFPADASQRTEQAQAEIMLGNTAASRGRYADAVEPYRRALAAARQAVAVSDTPAAQRTLIECLSSLGYFNMYTDRAASAKLFAEAVDRGEKLLIDPAASFESRVLAAYSRVTLTTLMFSQNKPAEAGTHLARGGQILASTKPDPTAAVRYQDQYEFTKAILTFFYGSRLAGESNRWAGKPEFATKLAEAVRELEAAVAGFDALIAVYPKMFPYRMYRLQALLALVRVHATARQPELRQKRLAEALAEEEAILTVSPEQTIVRSITAAYRAIEFVERVKTGDLSNLDSTADSFLTLADTHENGPSIRYNVACALSLGSREPGKAGRADRAVKELTALLGTRFLANPGILSEVRTDPDLKPLHGRADFTAFLDRAKASGN